MKLAADVTIPTSVTCAWLRFSSLARSALELIKEDLRATDKLVTTCKAAIAFGKLS